MIPQILRMLIHPGTQMIPWAHLIIWPGSVGDVSHPYTDRLGMWASLKANSSCGVDIVLFILLFPQESIVPLGSNVDASKLLTYDGS